jgi:hypothetical protein
MKPTGKRDAVVHNHPAKAFCFVANVDYGHIVLQLLLVYFNPFRKKSPISLYLLKT